MQPEKRILKLQGKVQHYAWGGFQYIPALLQLSNPEKKPFAEYWMGAHTSAPSQVLVDDHAVTLNKLIATDPSTYVGTDVYQKFGGLPYLFKVLDVRDMLSIQVHPTKEEAQKGFEAEEAAGISINSPHRNYKDKNHKPEVMIALTDFWLLHGFKQANELRQVLQSVPEFNFLLPVFDQQGYKGLYKEVMEMSQEKVNHVLAPLVQRVRDNAASFARSEPGFWVNKLFAQGEVKDLDRGIFSIYFFNIVYVKPGEAVFQAAGVPHAYLEGQNIELMANSDNVLRGGLTPKHIDVAELIKHTRFEGITPEVLKGDAGVAHEVNYPCPVEDFGISAITLKDGDSYSSRSRSAEIYILVKGSITAANETYKKGEAFYVLPATDVRLEANSDSVLYKAFVPAK